ncbi:MAG: TonB-system energizer ExbB [Deltaproteobacteria bacterium]|jgi:biopolymer transport protein ExbB|nr:TonB-system energizer ExbB [Deltaproteobacteria bacterium]
MEWLKYAVDYGIIGLLVVLSVCSLAIAIERFYVFRHVRLDQYGDKNSLEVDLTRNLHHIASIGSNAPYIGLLGTVLGIMLTFYSMGHEGLTNATKIMTGLALALKATAVGLLVAIPSVILYNHLLRRVWVLVKDWERSHGT